MRWLIFLLPMLAWGQSPTGSVHGRTSAGAGIRLISFDHSTALDATADSLRTFRFGGVAPGWYILAASSSAETEAVKAVHIRPGQDFDAGEMPTPVRHLTSEAIQILSVCQALARQGFSTSPVVIVGIFKSGMDPTLRQDCPNELVSGEVGWMSAIALSGSIEPPDQYRDQIEKKKAEIYASYPSDAKPRPERLVGLYGVLVVPDGLTSAPCCHAQAETTFAPARLIGVDEKDRRVIR